MICHFFMHMKISFKKCRLFFFYILNIIAFLIVRSFFIFEYNRVLNRSFFFLSYFEYNRVFNRSLTFSFHILNIIAHIIARDSDHNMKNSSMLIQKKHHNQVVLCLIFFECFKYSKLTLNEKDNVMKMKIN